jgi:membrane protease YdiL (CAAX protease family)
MLDQEPEISTRPLAQLLVIAGLAMLGILIFSGLGLAAMRFWLPEAGSSPQGFPNLQALGSDGRTALLLVQGLTQLGGFLVFPMFVYLLLPGTSFEPKYSISPNLTILLLIVGLAMLMMPVNSWLATLNQSVQLPSFLKGFEKWAHDRESETEQLTLFLVDFDNPAQAVLGFVVIAGIAGITEEYFFRKLVQPRIFGLTSNIHLAVWMTAFIFSAIHVQFLGLIPRMALGALFGYYYVWTGNIRLAMFGHFLNNSITLAGIYLYRLEISPINVEDPQQIPWYLGPLAAGVTWSLSVMVKDEADKIRSRKKQLVQVENRSNF